MKRLFLRSVCLLLALTFCAGLLPALTVGASAAVTEERQQALVATAMAYFDKGHSIQYDGSTIVGTIKRADGGKTRSTNQVAPEYATPQETMFSVCSDFAHQVYYETYRYQLGGSAGGCWTGGLTNNIKASDPICVMKWEKKSGKDAHTAIDEMLAIAEPGDVFTSVYPSGSSYGGHTMLYVGDVLGDGVKYIAHCWGKPISSKSGDVREYPKGAEIDKRYGFREYTDTMGGAIRLNNAHDFIHEKYGTDKESIMTLLRPLKKMSEEKYPISAATKYRMAHPRLAIDRYLNKTRFNSAFTGETVTMTLTLSNSSKGDYTVPVTEKVPAGATVKKPFEGATVADGVMKWDAELKAGEKKTFTCDYEITAKRGEQVVFEGGSVGDIPSNSIPIRVGGKKLTADDTAKLAALAKGEYKDKLAAAGATAENLGNVVYQQILGLNVRLPRHTSVRKDLVKRITVKSGAKIYTFKNASELKDAEKAMYDTLVPTCWGGYQMRFEWGHERCVDPRDKHLEPGDVLVSASTITASNPGEQRVYLGDGKYLKYDAEKKDYVIVEEPEFVMCLFSRIFYVLRPTLVYDDLHTLPALETELKFDDVKENDWYYAFVKDLVDDGTVSGMTATSFAPNGTLTYGQALKLIALAVGEKEPAKSGSHWASGYLTLAKEKMWLTEDVNLDGTISRLAFCKIAAKAKKLSEQPEKNPFTDTKDKDVLALYKVSVISGMTATEFKPEGLLTRAQIAKIIWMLRLV